MDEEHPEGWTKPKQSFRLKKSIPRKRPVLGSSNTTLPTRTVPATTSQPVKRRNSFDNDQENISSGASKKQRLGDIFSPSSSFLGNKSLPPALQRRVSENNDSRGELTLISCLLLINNISCSSDSGVLSDFSCSSPDSDQSRVSHPPLDWSLKTRLRILSPAPLGWSQHLSTVEEVSHLMILLMILVMLLMILL